MSIDYSAARRHIEELSLFLEGVRRDRPIWFLLFADSNQERAQRTPPELDLYLGELFGHILVAFNMAENAQVTSVSNEGLEVERLKCERMEASIRSLEQQGRSIALEMESTRALSGTLNVPPSLIARRLQALREAGTQVEQRIASSSSELAANKSSLERYRSSLQAVSLGAEAYEVLLSASAICERLVAFIARECSTAEGLARATTAERSYAARKAREEQERVRRQEADAREQTRAAEINARNARRLAERRRAQMEIGLAAAKQAPSDAAPMHKIETPPPPAPGERSVSASDSIPTDSLAWNVPGVNTSWSPSQWIDERECLQRKFRPWI